MNDRDTNRVDAASEDSAQSVRGRRRLGRLHARLAGAALLTALLLGGGVATVLALPGAAGADATTTDTTSTSTASTNTTSTATTNTTTSTATTTTETSTTGTSSTAPGFTTCKGHVTPAPKAVTGEPNLLDYSLSCNGDMSSYSVIVDRSGESGGTVDDFNPVSSVSAGAVASTTEGFNCGGQIPSNGFNCDPQSSTKPSPMTAGDTATGDFDPVEAYCKHLPSKAKAGALAIPAATVSIVVTDTSGFEEGPFTLTDTKRCPKVPNVAPAKKRGKANRSKKKK